jgi:hypothetical protein
VEFRSTNGRVAQIRPPRPVLHFDVPLTDLVIVDGPDGQKMNIGFMRLADLHQMYHELGPHFFDSNIRYGLGEGEAVNRAISAALKKIILDNTEKPSVFAFDHNGITLYAEQVEHQDGHCRLTAPRLLNGAQTVTTLAGFLKKNESNPKLKDGREALNAIRVLCKIITKAEPTFVTRVTVNNNRQNPVAPWNLRANDLIQLQLHEKFVSDVGSDVQYAIIRL